MPDGLWDKVKNFAYRNAPEKVQEWIDDNASIHRIDAAMKELAANDERLDHESMSDVDRESLRTYEKDANNGIDVIDAWENHLRRLGITPDSEVRQQTYDQKDLIDRMTSIESGKLPGTTPTLEPRSSIEAAWNPQTGTFQSAAIEFALEEPNVISMEEFSQDHQTERADGKINAPEQEAFEFDGREDEFGELAIGGFNVNGQWVSGDNNHEDFWATNDKEAANIAAHNHEETERQWSNPGTQTRSDDDMER